MTIEQQVVTVAAPGTLVAATFTEPRARKIIIAPFWGNAGPVYVGIPGLVRATGVGVIRRFAATDLPYELTDEDGQYVNVNDLRFDADNAGGKILVTILR